MQASGIQAASIDDTHPPKKSGASTIDAVVTAITAAIRAGQIVPGQRLGEQEFSQRLGVSRSSVREAFQRLSADGLLTSEPNRGVTVRQLSREEVDNLFDVRTALETLAVRLATPCLARAPDMLLALLDEMDAAVEDGQTGLYSDLNRRFHALMTEAADNALLAQMLGRLGNSIYGLQFRLMIEARDVLSTHAQHRRLADAIIANDATTAERVIVAHVEATRSLVQALPDTHFATASPPLRP